MFIYLYYYKNKQYMKQTIFYLEGRGSMYLFHFFIYNLGGLMYILNKEYHIRGEPNSSVLLEDKRKIVDKPTTEITFPIKIYMKDILPFQKEAFEIIKDKFELIEDLNTISDYEIVSIYGEISRKYLSDNRQIIFPFIRNLFLEKCNYNFLNGKRIFITRKNSELQHNGILKRYILNENELKNMLSKYNFEFIQLEDYKTEEKIKLFMQSEIIVSSHSGALTFTLFSDTKTKIIEILNKGTKGFDHNHYVSICDVLKLNYNRYTNIKEDVNGNFNINVDNFENYLLQLM